MRDVLFKYTNCPNFKNSVAMTLSRYTLFLFLTFYFSLFTFHLGAQGVTRYGQSTSSSANFVDKNGKIGSIQALSKNGQVFAVPGAPTNVTATAGDGQVTLTFTAPVSNGGSAITGYTVTSSPDGFTGTGSGSPITVAGLTNLTAYTFTIIATNAVGTGTASAQSNSVIPGTVTSSTGKIWMDRNLGASRVATSSNDAASYGDLYQWGRGTDGHQIRTSENIASYCYDSDTPGHGKFILTPEDWRIPRNDNLWQGVNGINNPCPSGYRLPTKDEWLAESTSWGSTKKLAEALASPLKLPAAGLRNRNDGFVGNEGVSGSYWASTLDSYFADTFEIGNVYNADVFGATRGYGGSVRCIKN